MNGREGFKAMNSKVVVLSKRDLNYKLKLVSNEDWEKRFEFFWASAQEKTQIRHDLPPLLSRILCGSLLFVDEPLRGGHWDFRFCGFGYFFDRFFGFCVKNLRFFGFGVHCSYGFSVF